MKASKLFIVVAYDISNSVKRNKVAKLLEQYGERVNMSVFECMITKSKLLKLQEKIALLIDVKTDMIVYYYLCVNCYCKIQKYPEQKFKKQQVIIA